MKTANGREATPAKAAEAIADSAHADAFVPKKTYAANPQLIKLINRRTGEQQYSLYGKPFGRTYRTKAHLQSAGEPLRQKAITGTGGEAVVHSRINTDSPFIKKRIIRHFAPSADRMAITNDLARSVEDNDLLRVHCAVEVFTSDDAAIARSVNGFTLRAYLQDPDVYPELDLASMEAKLGELEPVLRELHRHGYWHVDLNPGNIMYDRTTGRMVLIDFADATRADRPYQLEFSLNRIRAHRARCRAQIWMRKLDEWRAAHPQHDWVVQRIKHDEQRYRAGSTSRSNFRPRPGEDPLTSLPPFPEMLPPYTHFKLAGNDIQQIDCVDLPANLAILDIGRQRHGHPVTVLNAHLRPHTKIRLDGAIRAGAWNKLKKWFS